MDIANQHQKQDAEMIRYAVNEIRSLRRQVDLLQAKVSTFEACFTMVNASVSHPTYGMAEDRTYDMESRANAIDKLYEAKPAAPSAPSAPPPPPEPPFKSRKLGD